MGVGVSSLRLRKALILRAYNLRDEDQTLAEQFAHLGERSEDGNYYIPLDGVKDYLGFGESSQVEGTYRRLLGGSLVGTRVLFTEFIEFLETGKTSDGNGIDSNNHSIGPVSLTSSSSSGAATPTRSSSKIRILKGFPGAHNGKGDLPIPGRGTAKSFPPGSPNDINGDAVAQSSGLLREKHEKALKLAQSLASADYTELDEEISANGSDPTSESIIGNDQGRDDGSGPNKQSEGTPEPKESGTGSDQADDISEYDGPEPIVEENEDDDDESRHLNGTLPKTREIMVHASSGGQVLSNNVWRKREVVKQEREVFYTTVDADGHLQELVEKETSETEVLHMESRDTGEFAHRETTLYQQKETFNNEIVSEQDGCEEYLHLKSNGDEYEHMESTMPAGRRGARAGGAEEANDGSASPRVGGAGGDEGTSTDFKAAADAQGGIGAIDLSGVNPDELDDETRAYFLYVLKEQREEAAYRLQAMKQQEEFCDQYAAFDGLDEKVLDEETKAYKEYLEQNIANLGRLLGQEIGIGIKNAMAMLEREREEKLGPEGDDSPLKTAGKTTEGSEEAKPTTDIMTDDYNEEEHGTPDVGVGADESWQGSYEEPDSPLPDSWFKDATAAPTPKERDLGSRDNAASADNDLVGVAESANVENKDKEDDARSTPASLHDID